MQQNIFSNAGQMQMAQMGQIMQEPPTVISTKDHLYVKDAMSWELTSMKRCFHFARESRDPEIQMALDRTGQMHLSHYLRLLNHLNNANMAVFQGVR